MNPTPQTIHATGRVLSVGESTDGNTGDDTIHRSASGPPSAKDLPGLVHFNRARQELELAASIDEVRQIRDKAEAMRIYARQVNFSLEMQNLCAEIKIRAERRLGEMLREAGISSIRYNNLLRGRTMRPRDQSIPSLSDLGISKSQSSRCQLISTLSEEDFEERVREVKKAGRELTTSDMVAYAKGLARERSRQDRAKAALKTAADTKPDERIRILPGDFREVLNEKVIEPHSVDLLITDPPYLAEYLPLFGDLGKFASRILKPGRLLITYSGHVHLPTIYELLCSTLDYVWTAAITYPTTPGTVYDRRIKTYWKPVLLFSNGPYKPLGKAEWFIDRIEGEGREKTHHDWEQGLSEALDLIDHFTFEGDLVVDPFLGSGTNAAASKTLRRRFIGCDVDEKAVGTALHRIDRVR